MDERTFDSLHDAVDAVTAAQDLDGAVHALVDVLRERFHLWSLRVSAFRSDETVQVLAGWSATESFFVSGTAVSTRLTPEMREITATVTRGYPVVIRTADADFGILDHLFRREGIAALGLIPLHDGEEVVGMLTLGSSMSDGLTAVDVPFLTGLGRGTEQTLVCWMRKDPQEGDA